MGYIILGYPLLAAGGSRKRFRRWLVRLPRVGVSVQREIHPLVATKGRRRLRRQPALDVSPHVSIRLMSASRWSGMMRLPSLVGPLAVRNPINRGKNGRVARFFMGRNRWLVHVCIMLMTTRIGGCIAA